MALAQIRSSVRWESTLIALFGTGLGLAVGTFIGWAMVHALADEGSGQLVFPIGSLVTVAGVAVLAGVGASLIPGPERPASTSSTQ